MTDEMVEVAVRVTNFPVTPDPERYEIYGGGTTLSLSGTEAAQQLLPNDPDRLWAYIVTDGVILIGEKRQLLSVTGGAPGTAQQPGFRLGANLPPFCIRSTGEIWVVGTQVAAHVSIWQERKAYGVR